jgi:DNA-directed RNA polymerase subunit E'/Rpb7
MEPIYLGAKLKVHVKHRVMQELEGQCLGRHGFVISVLDVKDEDIEPGLVDNDTGAVNVLVWYTVILLRPYRCVCVCVCVYVCIYVGMYVCMLYIYTIKPSSSMLLLHIKPSLLQKPST